MKNCRGSQIPMLVVEITARTLLSGLDVSKRAEIKALVATNEQRLKLAEQLQDAFAQTLATRPNWDPAFFCRAVVAKKSPPLIIGAGFFF
jgi:hypothetical protein